MLRAAAFMMIMVMTEVITSDADIAVKEKEAHWV